MGRNARTLGAFGSLTREDMVDMVRHGFLYTLKKAPFFEEPMMGHRFQTFVQEISREFFLEQTSEIDR